jgi:hypothetical protein
MAMMMPTLIEEQAPVPSPPFQRGQARLSRALHIDALTLVTMLHLLALVRLDAAYWGLRLIAWIQSVLGAVAVVAWNPKNQKNRSCLPPTWTREELGKRSAIERFFGRVFLFFHLQRPPPDGLV